MESSIRPVRKVPEGSTKEEGRYKEYSYAELEQMYFSHTLDRPGEVGKPNRKRTPYTGIVSEFIEDILNDTKVGRDFAEASLSIQHAIRKK